MSYRINEQLSKIYESLVIKEKEHKPDYRDVDGDGDKSEPMVKAVKDAKCECGCDPKSPKKGCTCKKKHQRVHSKHHMEEEGLRFKEVYNKIISEAKINKEEQYDCVMDDGKKKKLKGESVIALKRAGKIKSYKPAFVEKK